MAQAGLMKIGITSQNFRSITGHAGKGRRFIIFTVEAGQPAQETGRLDLPMDTEFTAFAKRRPGAGNTSSLILLLAIKKFVLNLNAR